jgi:hypothetical protein
LAQPHSVARQGTSSNCGRFAKSDFVSDHDRKKQDRFLQKSGDMPIAAGAFYFKQNQAIIFICDA